MPPREASPARRVRAALAGVPFRLTAALLVLGCHSCNGKVADAGPSPGAGASAPPADASATADSGAAAADAAGELPPPTLGTGPMVACGAGHACGIRRDGTLACWYGNLNFLPTTPGVKDTLLDVPSGEFAAVGVSHDLACAVRRSGKVVCWGFPATYMHGWQPKKPAAALAVCGSRLCTLDGAGAVSDYDYGCPVGYTHGPLTQIDCACALTRDGAIVCEANQTYPAFPPPPAGHDFVQISTGDGFHCALRSDGRIVCWGVEDPHPPQGKFLSISVYDDYACAIRDDHHVVCFVGPSMDHNVVPTMLDTPPDLFAQVSAGTTFGCGITLDGAAKCWGWHPQAIPEDFP